MKNNRFLVVLLASSFVVPNISTYAAQTSESSTESTTTAIDNLNNNMNELNEKYDTSAISGGKNKGNHGGTTMTLSEYQNMINSNQSDFQKINNDDMFNIMKNSLDAGEDISLGEAFSKSNGLEIPDNFMYDLSDCGMSGKVDAKDINLDYANLLSNMDKNYELNSDDLSKNTVSATSLFKNTYGDLADKLKIKDATLPKNFSIKKITKQNSKAINSAYNDAFGSSDYNKVRSKVNSSNIFDKASHGLSMPDLLPLSDLSDLTSNYDSQLESKWNSKTNDSKSRINDIYNSHKTTTDSKYSTDISETQAKREQAEKEKADTESSMNEQKYKDSTTTANPVGKLLDKWGAYKWIDNIDYNKKAQKRAEKKKRKEEKKRQKEEKKKQKQKQRNDKT